MVEGGGMREKCNMPSIFHSETSHFSNVLRKSIVLNLQHMAHIKDNTCLMVKIVHFIIPFYFYFIIYCL